MGRMQQIKMDKELNIGGGGGGGGGGRRRRRRNEGK